MENYYYCGVKVKGIETVYSYISMDGELPVGSYVSVPFGRENDEHLGIVVSCGLYTRETAPYPVEKTKLITRTVTKEEYDTEESLVPYWVPDSIAEVNHYIMNENWDAVFWWAMDNYDDDNDCEPLVKKTIECFELCAAQGMPVAALNLGTYYYNGRYVPQDFKKAFELYKTAADAGELRAICNCGYCFYYGRHQEVDYAEAFKYFSLGALLYNDVNCLYKLGDMYLNGYGVPKNEAYAYMLYKRALKRCKAKEAEKVCLPDAQFRVGKCLLTGVGTDVDIEKAHKLLSNALVGFYGRRKSDPFVSDLIKKTKELLSQAQEKLDIECNYPVFNHDERDEMQ